MSYFSVIFITEININLKSWPIISLWHKLLQHLERWNGKTKYYPKLRIPISPQFSEAELSWELNWGEFSEVWGLDLACYNGRLPLTIIKIKLSGISQQLIIVPCSNFNLVLTWPNHIVNGGTSGPVKGAQTESEDLHRVSGNWIT